MYYLVILKMKLKAKRKTCREGHAQTREHIRTNRLKDDDVLEREF